MIDPAGRDKKRIDSSIINFKSKTKPEIVKMSEAERKKYVDSIMRAVHAEQIGRNHAPALIRLYKALPRSHKTAAIRKKILPFDLDRYNKK